LPGALVLGFWRDPTGQALRISREHGDVASFRFGSDLHVLVNDPEAIRRVLVTDQRLYMKGKALQEAKRVLGEGLLTSEGEHHLRQRRLIQPLFHHGHIGAYGEAMTQLAEGLQGRWRHGETRDLHEDMTRLTLAIVGRTLFDADVKGEAREIGEALEVALESVNTLVFPFGSLWERSPLPGPRRFRRACERLDATIYRLIAERRAAGLEGSDLLSLLLRARDEAGDGAGMTDRQVRDEAMTLFLAGHETTANLLTWTWYLLSQAPEAEQRLHAELDRVLGGRLPRVEDLHALSFMERVIDESLRLYPPVWLFGRRALEDTDLGGYAIPRDTVVSVSQWVTHHDPRWYPDPWRFDPDRWDPGEAAKRPQHAFFPFGGGTRVCIGEGFARMEAKLVLATIASRWQLRLAAGHRVELRPRITLRPHHGMPMVVEQRPQGGRKPAAQRPRP
jgi:cytochrome P450